MVTVDPNEVMKVVAGAFQNAADTLKDHFDKKESIILTEETARKIWLAAITWHEDLDHVVGGAKPEHPDFETFYKQLIEGK